ncbi:L(+)-tartrate dehydratase subunit alpha [Acerihabitans arboris]|uniref:L(+)-tartrate dehydratase subunit alpha n=1 Tax=Acerihabitans arboris TaxID=2691583 RepID=A0A845SSJ8_9GAMM|nr:L(+)-tartrate dehydratase subunit alpha [Acerihabitans arboris]NDL65826.1 L(+)-tartrate dehydratase subunit alpha [Acerihabitans arboris]
MTRFTGYVGKRLPTDVIKKLEDLRAQENSPLAKVVYDSMFINQQQADKLDRPCCQDTGVIQYFITAGANFPYLGQLADILEQATLEATKNAPLRHNAVETFIEKNTGTNTGSRIPWLDWDITPDDDGCTIEVYMAGGGCSLPGAAKVLMPGQGYEGVNQFVFDVITSYGINACPPLLVGVGISTSVETAARLSKKAILRPVTSHHTNADAAKMEQLLEDGLNKVGLGPQGLGGNCSVMGVNIESSARHPSTIGVAVSTGCWAHRRGAIHFTADLAYEILSHEGAVL